MDVSWISQAMTQELVGSLFDTIHGRGSGHKKPSMQNGVGGTVNDKKISGQLFFRDAGAAEHLLPGENKKLVMVVGIIAVDANTEIHGEHQYAVSGIEHAGVSQLHIHMRYKLDLTEKARGVGLGHLVTMPIWRI